MPELQPKLSVKVSSMIPLSGSWISALYALTWKGNSGSLPKILLGHSKLSKHSDVPRASISNQNMVCAPWLWGHAKPTNHPPPFPFFLIPSYKKCGTGYIGTQKEGEGYRLHFYKTARISVMRQLKGRVIWFNTVRIAGLAVQSAMLFFQS